MKTYKRIVLAAVLSLAAFPIPLHADAVVKVREAKGTNATAKTTEEAAVRSTMKALSEATSKGDAAKMASLWATDGSYIDEDGDRVVGREALEKRFAEAMADQKRSNISVSPTSIKFIGANAVWLEGTSNQDTPEGPQALARFTMLLEKQNNQWLIASATETAIAEKTVEDELVNLSWLIGKWQASAGNKAVTMSAEWVGNKNFIICRFVSKEPGSADKVDVQIIGWDPIKNKVVSWHFDSNGGFGYGTWDGQGTKWLVKMEGVQQAGTRTGAINIISKEGDDKFSWQSVNRSVGGVMAPDTEPLIVQRIVK